MSKHVTLIYDDAIAVTKSDSTDDPAGPFAGILVLATGTIKVTTIRGTDVAITGSPAAGIVIPLAVKRVWSTGTGATVMGLVEAGYHGPRASAGS